MAAVAVALATAAVSFAVAAVAAAVAVGEAVTATIVVVSFVVAGVVTFPTVASVWFTTSSDVGVVAGGWLVKPSVPPFSVGVLKERMNNPLSR